VLDRSLLADLVLFLHFGFVVFIVGGLVAIWIGVLTKRRWIFNRRFRLAHLCAMWFVAIETLLGFACPLTVLEDLLRRSSTRDSGFIQRWIARLLYWDLPLWVFAATYLAFAFAVTLTYLWRPPTRRIES
jgi:hypothetical protein